MPAICWFMPAVGERMAAAHVSPYGGLWYPRQERRLSALLDEVFDESGRRTGPHLLPGALAMIVPHAAPQYSGTVAAAAYRHLQAGRAARVFILGFSHAGMRRGVAIPNVARYRTPLGDVAVDLAAAHELCRAAPFRLVDESEACDHSVEIQLPYLQKATPGARVIPLYVGRLEDEGRTAAAEALARLRRPGDVLLASSDLTHYGASFSYVPFPADSRTPFRLRELDRSVLSAASSLDCGLFFEMLRKSGATACGDQPISLLLRTLALMEGEEIFQQELDYQTSGEITGDYTESVSYAAAGFFRRSSFDLEEPEARALLRSAQATLDHLRLTGQREPIPPPDLPDLARRAPLFVTLHHGDAVTGCLGRAFHCLPLAEAVPELTLSAALDDPRSLAGPIPPDTEIEISLLTPMKLVRGAEALRIGRDGGYLECGPRRGILLPQVARPGWTAERFVELLYRKAGFEGHPSGAAGRLSLFQAQVLRQ